MITGVILDICNMSVTWMCMVDGEDNPELIEKYLSCMESNSKNNRKIWMMQQMQKDGLMFAKKLMLSTGK